MAEVSELLEALEAAPDDQALRARAAEALTAAGQHARAAGVLGEGLINLTAHDGPTLPCLCRRCLQPERARAEAEGMGFVRRFAVARGRVLWYWSPSALGDAPGLRREVARRLDERLAGSS